MSDPSTKKETSSILMSTFFENVCNGYNTPFCGNDLSKTYCGMLPDVCIHKAFFLESGIFFKKGQMASSLIDMMYVSASINFSAEFVAKQLLDILSASRRAFFMSWLNICTTSHLSDNANAICVATFPLPMNTVLIPRSAICLYVSFPICIFPDRMACVLPLFCRTSRCKAPLYLQGWRAYS